MNKLEKLLSQYAAYHLDHKNIVTHFVGIPLIVFSIMCLTARAGMTIGSFEITLAMVLILASIVYYLSLDRIFGVIMLVIYAMAYPLAYKISQFDLGRTFTVCFSYVSMFDLVKMHFLCLLLWLSPGQRYLIVCFVTIAHARYLYYSNQWMLLFKLYSLRR